MARLAALLAALGLATSRVGLIIHELVGHGGTAVALGGEIRDFRMFWFAGGWIRYHFPDGTRDEFLAISLGGIVIEAVIGAAVWLVLTRADSLWVRLARGAGAAFVIHAAWYFATGTWHAYGDGWQVSRALGDARYPAAIIVGLFACGATFAAARLLLGALAAQIPGSPKSQVIGVVAAAILAGGLQITLAFGEVRVRGDSTYGAIMITERDRNIERDLRLWHQQQRGTNLADRDILAARDRIAKQHDEQLPFAPVLAIALLAAVVAGARRARAPTDPLTTRHLVIAGALAGGSIASVIAIDAAFH